MNRGEIRESSLVQLARQLGKDCRMLNIDKVDIDLYSASINLIIKGENSDK